MAKRLQITLSDALYDKLLKSQKNKSGYIENMLIRYGMEPKPENSVCWFRSSDLTALAWGVIGT
jgi:hypothetical protein